MVRDSFHACSGRVTIHGLGEFVPYTEGKGHLSMVINTSQVGEPVPVAIPKREAAATVG